MGNDAFIHINKKEYSSKSVERLLLMLDYQKRKGYYYCGNDDEYKYLSGVSVWKDDENDDELIYRVRTQMFSSGYDIKKQNDTIRTLKTYCKAWFISDLGKNRYFPTGPLVKGAESGCYFALQRLDNNFTTLLHSLNKYPLDNTAEAMLSDYGFPPPSVFNANVYLAYLCALMEEFFRSTYIALLKYADNKEKIINVKFSPFDMVDISNGVKSVEEVYARTLSFQNIHKINYHFMSLNRKLDISKPLKEPYNRRKESLFLQIDRLFECRHSMIHKTEMNLNYSSSELQKDIKDIKTAFTRVYKFICKQYGWIPEEIII